MAFQGGPPPLDKPCLGKVSSSGLAIILGCSSFAYNLGPSCLQWSFFAYNGLGSFLLTLGACILAADARLHAL